LSDPPKYRIVSILALFIQPILVNLERIKELATNKNGNKPPCIIAIKEGSSTFRAAQWNRGKEGSGEVVANFSGLVFL